MATSVSTASESSVDLPSFDLRKFVNIENSDDTQELLNRIGAGNGTSQSLFKRPADVNTRGTTQVHIEEQARFRFSNKTKPEEYHIDANELMAQRFNDPQLILHVPNEFSRFRYESEKSKTRKRSRHYEDANDKQSFLDIKITNFQGHGKVIAFCTDATGSLHAFHLHGEGCFNGVFVGRFKFKEDNAFRLHGVSVTMPTSKKGDKFLETKVKYLEELKVPYKLSESKSFEKQLVHVKVFVKLEDEHKTVLEGLSSAFNNRKQGKEFLIDVIQPPSAPAWGSTHKVLVVVTNGTFFPQDPGIIIRDRKIGWQKTITGSDLEVIRKAVIKFVPPPYMDHTTSLDVQVELSLCDMKTQKETEPASFLYYGSDEYGVEQKSKKRKLAISDVPSLLSTSASCHTPALKKQALSRIRNESELGLVNMQRYQDASSCSGTSTPDNVSDTSVEMASTQTLGQPIYNQAAASQMPDVFNISANPSTNLPFTSFRNERPGTTHTETLTTMVVNSQSQDRPPSAGFDPYRDATYGLQQTQQQQQQQQSVYQTATLTSNYQSSTNNQQFQSQSQQMGLNQLNVAASTQHNMPSPASDNLTQIPQNVMPNLGPNHQLAIIDGKIYIINDDTKEDPQTVSLHEVNSQHIPDQSTGQSHPMQQAPMVQPNLAEHQPQSQSGESGSRLNSANLQALVQQMTPDQVAVVFAQAFAVQVANMTAGSGNVGQQTTTGGPPTQQLDNALGQAVSQLNAGGGEAMNQGGASDGNQDNYDDLDDDDVEIDGEEKAGMKMDQETDDIEDDQKVNRSGHNTMNNIGNAQCNTTAVPKYGKCFTRSQSRSRRVRTDGSEISDDEDGAVEDTNVQDVIIKGPLYASQIPTCVTDITMSDSKEQRQSAQNQKKAKSGSAEPDKVSTNKVNSSKKHS